MQGIKVGRWLAGGVIAGLIMWLIEGGASGLYQAGIEAALQAHNLSPVTGAHTLLIGIVASLLAGLTMIFFYAAARPRFGPGPRTAVTVAVALWIGGYLPPLLGYHVLGLFPTRMLGLWAVVGLVEMVIAGLGGAWIYREPGPGA